MELRKFIATTIREYLNENNRINVETESFYNEHPNIKPIKFPIKMLKDNIEKWKLNNYDVNIRDQNIVDSLLKINNNDLPPIISYKYTNEGGYKIIDGWHRATSSYLRGDKYINALVKDYTIEALQ